MSRSLPQRPTRKEISVSDHLKELVATIGENMSLRRTVALKVKDGVVATYVHNPGRSRNGQDRRSRCARV